MKPLYIAVISNRDKKPSRLIIRDDARELIHVVQERLAVKHSTEYPETIAEYQGEHRYCFYDTFVEFIARYMR